jgi:flagellar basal-body rod modification protein FlgD
MGINDRLDLLMTQQRGLANSEVVGLVGKTATVRGSIITTDGGGFGVPVRFTLQGPAAETTVTIRDQNGRVVRTLDVGAKNAGLVTLQWDGRDNAGNVQPAGTYVVGIVAKNEADAPVLVSQEARGLVSAVSFDKGYPVLHLDTGISVPVSDLIRVDSPPNP